MMQALADLPPVALSDLIGIQPRTAERFAAMAGENWSDYLAATRPRPHQAIGRAWLKGVEGAAPSRGRPGT